MTHEITITVDDDVKARFGNMMEHGKHETYADLIRHALAYYEPILLARARGEESIEFTTAPISEINRKRDQ